MVRTPRNHWHGTGGHNIYNHEFKELFYYFKYLLGAVDPDRKYPDKDFERIKKYKENKSLSDTATWEEFKAVYSWYD